MHSNIIDLMEYVGLAVDILGVIVMVIGATVSTIHFLSRLRQGRTFRELYTSYRHGIGRSIILGLEFLVAGDIIRTVAVRPTYQSVIILACIVGIRTFLGMTLSMEVEGHWPWNKRIRLERKRRTLKGEQ